MKVLVFDLGGTLMEYEGMPNSWVGYYHVGFEAINADFRLGLSQVDIQKSCEILTSKNARVVYREIEYTPNEIFAKVTAHWHKKMDLDDIINSFFKGHELKPVIYKDTIDYLCHLRRKGIKIAALTDLPTAMPDEIFKKDIPEILSHLDLYVSSLTCGFRKPNKNGLLYISEYFGVDVCDLIFIGDEEKDIKAAKNASCVSVLIDRKNDKKDYGQDFTVTSLSELEQILEAGGE